MDFLSVFDCTLNIYFLILIQSESETDSISAILVSFYVNCWSLSRPASGSDVNKDLTFKAKDKDQDKDQTPKDKDQTVKAKDQDKDYVNYNQYRVKLEKIMSDRT